MGPGSLTVYSASAGSGKTFTLTGIYLEKLFISRHYYRKILAVTFTNKATAEMKGRILDELHNLASGRSSRYLDNLRLKTGRKEVEIRNEAKTILHSLLHDYSRFSVSTIDSFFQKIIRAFARDIGFYSGFVTELDHNAVLLSAVNRMISSASADSQIRKWLLEYAKANIEDEKTWDLKREIFSLGGELFNEKFKLLSLDEREKLGDKDFLLGYISELKVILRNFESRWNEIGRRCSLICHEYNLTDDMFYRKKQGIPGFIAMMIKGVIKPPNSYVREIERDPPRWTTGPVNPALARALAIGLEDAVREALQFYDAEIENYKSASVILDDIYALGILSDVLKHVRLLGKDENTFLLSEAGELIHMITEKDQAPFIYERVGNRYEVFMIDEFQDTSVLQWKNFKPLIENSMSEGNDNLVVGDVKQSIYRWRNGDWRILGELREIESDQRIRTTPLKTNRRSCRNIIRFNNSLFSVIPRLADEELGKGPFPLLSELYSEAVQEDPGQKENGYIRLEFVEDDAEMKWHDKVLDKLPFIVESFQDYGYSAGDIGILVRDNKEGARVMKKMIGYLSGITDNRRKYNYNIVSNDSLLLSNSPVLNFIMAALAVLNDRRDMLSRAAMLRHYLLATGKSERAFDVSLHSDEIERTSESYFPEGCTEFLETVKYKPLWNITEEMIRFFRLGEYRHNIAWLSQFQDLVLHYCARKNNELHSFIEWWETDGSNKSLTLPEDQEAMRVLTIHKSKGLEFKIVILPFISWNLDHKAAQKNILWVRPGKEPFNRLGIVPVRYKKELADTVFKDSYYEERYSAYLDNINLLYVAFTRARDAICGFAPLKPSAASATARIVRDALVFKGAAEHNGGIVLSDYYDHDKNHFEFGSVPLNVAEDKKPVSLIPDTYPVVDISDNLQLRFHGMDYIIPGTSEIQKRINYGKIMHGIFEKIVVRSDIKGAVASSVLEGHIEKDKAESLEKKIELMLSDPVSGPWFEDGNEVMTEASIILPGSGMRRPDRIITKDGKVIIVDFKFGEENPRYYSQVREYCRLLSGMGYKEIKAFIWYVDSGKIKEV